MLCLLIFPSVGYAKEINYIVVGVIAKQNGEGIALLKDKSSKETFASKTGSDLKYGLHLKAVHRKNAIFVMGRETITIEVGANEGVSSSPSPTLPQAANNAISYNSEIERKGNDVKITASYRDHLINNELSTILMQAAAVPYYENGTLRGFRLLEIDPASIYEQAGLVNNDIIVAINDEPIVDVSRTIKTLHSLKNEPNVKITLQRGDLRQDIAINVN